MPATKSFDFHRELENTRLRYIENLPQAFAEIDSILDQIEGKRPAEVIDSVRELNQKIHGLKGTSGTFEIKFLSTACSNFIDRLRGLLDLNDETIIDITFFRNVTNLMKCFANEMLSGSDAKFLGAELDQVTDAKRAHRILLVEKQSQVIENVRKKLAPFEIELSVEHSGHEAFLRLINERFDSLISDCNIGPLDGAALVAISKVISGPSKNLFTILLSSNDQDSFPLMSVPDRIIAKDENLLIKLEEIYKGFTEHKSEVSLDVELKIAVVDDDDEMNTLFKLAFKGIKDTSLEVVKSSTELHELLNTKEINLIILDIMLDGEDGFEILENLRLNSAWSKIPVIFVSSRNYQFNASVYQHKGVIGWISKPFKVKQLPKIVANLVQQSRPRVYS